ncbi:MAG: GvpL/GvpF family gas vesicle protein, partial [Deltaproteobacteria bacterium]|nr:GvpL/GvpF family gas vesicle protein [Deltaproteobacteria bacterium]
MSPIGRYLYCIVRCGEERAFYEAAPIGGEDGPVYTIPHDGLAAVVSNAQTGRHDPTRANMLSHQRV